MTNEESQPAPAPAPEAVPEVPLIQIPKIDFEVVPDPLTEVRKGFGIGEVGATGPTGPAGPTEQPQGGAEGAKD
jgi:hypothetical protein